MRAPSIRVIIADDHPVIINGIENRLRECLHMTVVGVAGSFPALIERLRTTVADVVILDLMGMQVGPITMVHRLKRDYPLLAIVVFSSNTHLAPELIKDGVLGYITKEELLDHLVAAIEAAHRGRPYLAPLVQEEVDHSSRIARLSDLSAQECNVLALLAQRLSTEEIANHLAIDPRTVQNYITNLRRKTGCFQRIELIDWYQRSMHAKS